MTVGPLERTLLDAAMSAFRALNAEKEANPGKFEADVTEIAKRKAACEIACGNLTAEIARLETEQTAGKRSHDARAVLIEETSNAIERTKTHLLAIETRLERARAEQEERIKEREAAEREAAVLAEESAKKAAGAGDLGQGDENPDLADQVKEWASSFKEFSAVETDAFLKGEATRIGLIIDVISNAATIRDLEFEADLLKARIEQQQLALDGLAGKDARVGVVDHSSTIARLTERLSVAKSDLEEVNRQEGMQSDAARDTAALIQATQAAKNEILGNLVRMQDALSDVMASTPPADAASVLEGFRTDCSRLSSAVQKVGTDDIAKTPPGLEKAGTIAEQICGKIDTYLDKTLTDLAFAARVAALTETIWDRVYREEVEKISSAEKDAELRVPATSLKIDKKLLETVARNSPALSFEPPASALEPIRTLARETHDRKCADLHKDVTEGRAQKETQRKEHRFHSVAGEPAFYMLLSATRRQLAREAIDADLALAVLRTNLQDALDEQITPSLRRWCEILAIKKRTILPAPKFTDSEDIQYHTHVTFFDTSLAPGANKGISVQDKSGKKPSVADVMKLLFEKDLNETGRAHATMNGKGNGDKDSKPHTYYGDPHDDTKHTRNYEDFFVRIVKKEEPEKYDKGWVSSAKKHAKSQLDKQMDWARARVTVWLEKNGQI